MTVLLYMDVHVPQAITDGLRRRSVDVLTAQEDLAGELDDPDLLDRARVLSRVLFTRDDDFLSIATERQRNGEPFASVVYDARLANVSSIWKSSPRYTIPRISPIVSNTCRSNSRFGRTSHISVQVTLFRVGSRSPTMA